MIGHGNKGSITDLLKWFSPIKLFIFELKPRNRVSGVRFRMSGVRFQVSGVSIQLYCFFSGIEILLNI